MNVEAFVNRELSWLEFNRRVLEEAQDPSVPLLERVKFLAIFSSNLDEFFMVRMAWLKRRIRAGDATAGPDGLTAAETMRAVAARAHQLVNEQHRCFRGELQPLLASEGIVLVRPKEVGEDQQRFLARILRPDAAARADAAGRRPRPARFPISATGRSASSSPWRPRRRRPCP